MKNMIDHDLAHRFIIKETIVRTLNYDLQHIEKMKSRNLIGHMYMTAIDKVERDLASIRKRMQKENLKLQAENKIDEYFTAYDFTQNGLFESLHYSNHAIKNQVMAEIEKLIMQK